MVYGRQRLLQQLNVERYPTQRYGNDLATVELYHRSDAKRSQDKKKRKTNEVKELEYEGVSLALTKEVKYLGHP